jgi:hypothetical protein
VAAGDRRAGRSADREEGERCARHWHPRHRRARLGDATVSNQVRHAASHGLRPWAHGPR